MAGPLAKYSLVNAKLRARISKILPDRVFVQLARAPSLEAALAQLRETPFARLDEIYSATGDLRQAELELLRDEIDLYRGLKGHLHRESVELVDALLCQFEIDNLKNAIRVFFDRVVRGRPAEASAHYILYEPILHDIPMDIVVNAQGFDEIAGVCEGTPYSLIIRKYSHTAESEGSLFRLEIALDHFYYANLLSAIERLDRRDRAIAERLAGVRIDLQNVDWIIRLRSFYDLPMETVLAAIVPGGFNLSKAAISELYSAQNVTPILREFVKTRYPGLSALLSSQVSDSVSRLLLIRRIMEEIMRQEVQRILAGYPFTVGIIVAYFVRKKNELDRVRIVLNAHQQGLQPERIEGLI
jgi:V/A-type H+-transporting ATPase subunit C